MSLEFYQGSRTEYIAEHEKYHAWVAALYNFSQNRKMPDTIDISKLRKKIQSVTGFPFSELSLRMALNGDNGPLRLASAVSDSQSEKYFRVEKKNVRVLLDVLPRRKENRIWRLMNLPHDSFRAEVATTRKEAAERFDKESERGQVWPPADAWTDYGFEYLSTYLRGPDSFGFELGRVLPKISTTAFNLVILCAALVTIVVGFFTLRNFGIL